MPRGKKSKLRAREKRYLAREGNQNMVGAQAAAATRQEPSSSSSPRVKSTQRGSRAAGTPSTPQGPQRAPSTSTPAAAIPNARSNEGASNQAQEIPSSSQAQSAIQLRRSPFDEKIALMVYYLLYKYQMKEPVTKGDMLRNVVLVYRNHFPEILKRAAHYLELIFGLDMKEVDPNRHTYVLVNKLELGYNERLSDDRGFPKTGFLMTILGLIFYKGNSATGQQICEVLNMMGVHVGRSHFIYGEPRKLIIDMVKEKYLEYQQVPNSDPPSYKFLWGPRAYAETSKMKVLEFLAKIYNTVPTAFPVMYEEAVRDEEERIQARRASRARVSAMANARATASSSSCPR